MTANELRALLVTKYGTLRKAFKSLDKGGNGMLGFHQLLEGLVSAGMLKGGRDESRQFARLFKEMCVNGSGALSLSDLVADAVEPPPDENEEWHYLTTAEQWTRWCERTASVSPKCRPPVWATPMATLNAVKDYDVRRERDLHRMRMMMAQGVHKTHGGLRLTAPHLLDDFDAGTVETYRREALETVEIASKRIRHALQESARSRHDLQFCVQELQRLQLQAKRSEKRDKLSQTRKAKAGSAGGLRVSSLLTVDAVNLLSMMPEEGDEEETGVVENS